MRNSRAKGVGFERDIGAIWAARGFAVRGLEAAGDHLLVRRDGLVLHSECKRQERVRLPEWWAQTVRDTPPGAVPTLTWRRNHGEPLTVLRTADLARLLGEAR